MDDTEDEIQLALALSLSLAQQSEIIVTQSEMLKSFVEYVCSDCKRSVFCKNARAETNSLCPRDNKPMRVIQYHNPLKGKGEQ